METYKITKEYTSYLKNFNSIQECENWVLTQLGDGYIIEISSEKLLPFTPQQRLPLDIDFGSQLINQFLIDNREVGFISIQDSITLLNKFNDIEKLCRLGAIKDVLMLMQNVITDSIFTQERKDKYLQMINDYLLSYN